jgi:hypothetical protein
MIPGLNLSAPDNQTGWALQFARQQSIPGWSHGDGTLCPLGSFPVGQAAHYYWRAKEWKIEGAYTITPPPPSPPVVPPAPPQVVTYHTGWIPYIVGWDGTNLVGRGFLGNGLSANPTETIPPALRRYGLNDGQSETDGFHLPQLTVKNSACSPISAVVTGGSYVGVGPALLAILGGQQAQFGDVDGFEPYSSQGSPGLIFDDATPGNVFMAFAFADYVVSSVNIGPRSTHAFDASLDGMTFPTYYDSTLGTIAGSLAITTKDN